MYIYIYIHIYIQEFLLILKKSIVLLHTFQHRTAYSSTIKFTCMISANVCVKDESMVKPMYTLVLIRHRVETILQKN